ncbi:MAG TPA: TIGR02206 family membrane protein [Candidatus Dormibacteraeota bacterium]|nr:TIGR02206 family membrane protein [Candidatus Dormibacteraeota bacterium]
MASWDHLGALGAAALLCAGLCTAARVRPGPWVGIAARTIAVVLVANLAIWQVVTIAQGHWSATNGLMLDLCPVSAVIGAAALWTRRRLLAELTYFWGCAGSLQGLITPDSRWHFPQYWWFQFYVTHAGVVVTALFLVIGLRLTPRPGAVRRVFVLTLGFAVVAALADLATGGNYMFLRNQGGRGTLLDVMGPWPWYIATGIGLALLFLAILDAPFRIRARTG